MKHSNLIDKSNPDNAELAYELDAILEPYNDVLGDIQIPWTYARNIVKAHKLGQRSKYETKLAEYQSYLEDNSVHDGRWRKSYYTPVAKRIIIRRGIQKGTWQAFMAYMDKVIKVVRKLGENGNFNVVRYSVVD